MYPSYQGMPLDVYGYGTHPRTPLRRGSTKVCSRLNQTATVTVTLVNVFETSIMGHKLQLSADFQVPILII